MIAGWSLGDWVSLAVVAATAWFLLNIRGNGDSNGGNGDDGGAQWYDRGRP